MVQTRFQLARAGQWAPPRRPRWTNVNTGRDIIIGGPTWHNLQEPGYLDDGLTMLPDAEGTSLVFDLADVRVISVQRIFSPSDRTLIDRFQELGINGRQAALLNDALLEGDQAAGFSWAEFVAAGYIEPWWVDHTAVFAFGPYVFQRADNPGANLQHDEADHRRVVAWLAGREELMKDNPLRLPFSNVLLNRGQDDLCVLRFLKMIGFTGSTVHDRTAQGIINWCEGNEVECRLYDVWGGIILQTRRTLMTPKDQKLSGVVYAGHLYPIEDAGIPTLLEEPTHQYDTIPAVQEIFNNNHSMWFQRGTSYHIGMHSDDRSECPVAGKYVQTGGCFEPWMEEWFKKIPVGCGWDPDVMRTIKQATQALLYSKKTTEEVVAYDMTKCYYNVLLKMARDRRLWETDIFCQWQPIDSHQQPLWISIDDLCWYRTTTNLSQFGIRANIISGRLVALFKKHAVQLELTHFVRFKPLGRKVSKTIVDVLTSWADDPERQKSYALLNGMMGRIRRVNTWWFEVSGCSALERQHYSDVYGFHDAGALMHVTHDNLIVLNRFHIHAAVVMGANEEVVKCILETHQRYQTMPVRIRVDSVTYIKSHLVALFQPGFNRYGWHDEPVVGPIETQQLSYTTICVDDPIVYQNRTWTGAPGTGKTYTIIKDTVYDIAVCFSNKGARRINGSTIHSALQLWNDHGMPMVERLRGLVVFVDEAQCVNRRIWGMFMHAYLTVGTRFIFSLDLRQLPPVGEEPISFHPFHGVVTTLTIDYRNDVALQEAREAVWAGTFKPNIIPKSLLDHYNLVNIAYINETCETVNEEVAEDQEMPFGKDGLYITKTKNKLHGWEKNDFFARRGNMMKQREGRLVVFVQEHEMEKWFEPAYCTTIHKQIGETIYVPFTIWDWNHPNMNKHIMYTAITRGVRLQDISFATK